MRADNGGLHFATEAARQPDMLDTLRKLRAALRPIYGQRETEAIILLLFHHLKGWNRVDLIMHETDTLSPFVRSEIEGILSRLIHHEPIQYITGEARFHGLDFRVTPDVLIPRPETDELVDIICDRADSVPDLRVLDIATGSGCIAVALARSLNFPKVTALDISPKALDVARDNARRLGATISFIEADIFSWTAPPSSFDIIVSNPPYIDDSEKADMEPNVLDYEPAAALFVPDNDPLVFYRRIAALAIGALSPQGTLYLEINPRHHEELAAMLRNAGLRDVDILKDSYGKDRFAIARRSD